MGNQQGGGIPLSQLNPLQLAQAIKKPDFPYTVGDCYGSTYLWKLHSGIRKSDKEKVTIFKHEFKSNDESTELARFCLKRLRSIRHPSILRFIDGAEIGNVIYVVTEYVKPLKEYLLQASSEKGFLESISWGSYEIVKCIDFLHSKDLYVCNLNMHSIFVDAAGDWKLGDLGFITEINIMKQNTQTAENNPYGNPLKRFHNLIPLQYRAPEVISQRWDLIDQYPDALDSWGMACIFYELFEGELHSSAQLRSPSKLPRELYGNYTALIHDNPTMRQRMAQLMECMLFQNNMVQAQIFLENIQLKEPQIVSAFLIQFPEAIDNFPKANLKYKVYPLLLNTLKYGGPNVSNAIISVFKIGTLFDETEMRDKFIPSVIDLFELNDKTVRSTLLKNMNILMPHITTDMIEKKIYVNVEKGFTDNDPAVREMTVKSMLDLVPKLSIKVVSENVAKHMWDLLGDREPGIRTNTVIAFGKLAPCFTEDIRKRVMLHGFIKALRDPFHHSRLSALRAIAATKEYYTPKDIATKIVPCCIPLMLDPETEVRDLTIQIVNMFVQFLTDVAKASNFVELAAQEVTVAGKTESNQPTNTSGMVDAWKVFTNYSNALKSKITGEKISAATTPTVTGPSYGTTTASTNSTISFAALNNSGTASKPIKASDASLANAFSTPPPNATFNTTNSNNTNNNAGFAPRNTRTTTASVPQQSQPQTTYQQPPKAVVNDFFDDAFDIPSKPSATTTRKNADQMSMSDLIAATPDPFSDFAPRNNVSNNSNTSAVDPFDLNYSSATPPTTRKATTQQQNNPFYLGSNTKPSSSTTISKPKVAESWDDF